MNRKEFANSPLAVLVPQEAMVLIVKLMGNQDGGKMPETLCERFDESSAWKDSPPEAQIAF